MRKIWRLKEENKNEIVNLILLAGVVNFFKHYFYMKKYKYIELNISHGENHQQEHN